MKIVDAIKLLDLRLSEKKMERSLIICGGASLNLQGISARFTKDVDVLTPKIDDELKKISIEISHAEDLSEGWLNNGPRDLIRDLEANWREEVVKVFDGQALTVYSISRKDMIFSKLFAMCDRQTDRNDLIALKVTRKEVEEVIDRVKKCDAGEGWEDWVEECTEDLLKEIENG